MKINLLPRLFLSVKFVAFVIVFMAFGLNSYAQWPTLPEPNVAISTSTGNEHNYWACTDGKGGSITVWEDDRTGDQNIYAQRIDKDANIMWTAGGEEMCMVIGHNHGPMVIEDGNGGAVMAWKDERAGSGGKDVFAQAVDSNGVIKWALDGIPICTDGSDQDKIYLVSDGAGGAIIAWQDMRNGNKDIFAQRVNSAGIVQWAIDGEIITTASDEQKDICMAADGVGGAIITWTDKVSDVDIYVQRIDASGAVQYAVDGINLTVLGSEQEKPDITADGFGNFVIGWQDKRGGDKDIYVQKINLAGVIQWPANGVMVCDTTGDQTEIDMVADAAGGVYMAWTDKRNGDEDIFSQRVNADGVMQWIGQGVAVSDAVNKQKRVHMAEASGSRTLMTWEDARDGKEDIYVQMLDSNGVAVLTPNGLATCTAIEKQTRPFIFHVGGDNWISVWADERLGNKDLFAQGYNPSILPIDLVSFQANANDNQVDLTWITSSELNNDYFTIERSSDAKNWEELITTSGAGNSNQLITYLESDYEPLTGISYYRLKQTDFNGEVSYSGIVPVRYEVNNDGGVINLFPSPIASGQTLNIEFKNIFENELLVVLRDIRGREYYSKIIINIEDGKLIGVPIDTSIPAGVYLITATSENDMYSQKLIIKSTLKN